MPAFFAISATWWRSYPSGIVTSLVGAALVVPASLPPLAR